MHKWLWTLINWTNGNTCRMVSIIAVYCWSIMQFLWGYKHTHDLQYNEGSAEWLVLFREHFQNYGRLFSKFKVWLYSTFVTDAPEAILFHDWIRPNGCLLFYFYYKEQSGVIWKYGSGETFAGKPSAHMQGYMTGVSLPHNAIYIMMTSVMYPRVSKHWPSEVDSHTHNVSG